MFPNNSKCHHDKEACDITRLHEANVQKMADFTVEDDEFLDDDFYAILNVRKEVECPIKSK